MKKPTMLAEWRVLALVVAAFALNADSANAQLKSNQPAVCSECHRNMDPALNRALTHADGMTCLSCHHLGMSNDPTTVAARRVNVCKDCHASVKPTHTAGADQATCTQCHSIHDDAPLASTPLPSARCQSCHEQPHLLHATVKTGAPECTACHTLHDGKPMAATSVQVSRTCVTCHQAPHPSHTATGKVNQGCTSCHRMSADKQGAAVPVGAELSAVCTSCHKEMKPAHTAVATGKPECADCHAYQSDARMPASQVAISERCGSCHTDALKSYQNGGHAAGMAMSGPNPDLPSCVSCHTTHGAAGGPAAVRLAATERCISCHSNEKLAQKYDMPEYVGASYLEDFHGATLKFAAKQHPTGEGAPNVMTCADCHGAHAVAWNVQATVSEVCLSCHEKGDPKLAGAWLGHNKASARNQPLVWLIRLFYYVLIPFVLAGLVIHIAMQLIDQRRKGATVRGTLKARFGPNRPRQEMVVRFSLLERFEHLGSMLTFILLCVTGLPQTRPEGPIAHKLIEFFGGIGSIRVLHRIVGVIFVALLVQHVARAIMKALRKHKLPVMATTAQDFRDVVGMVRHYIWGTPRPKTGKFDFSEKFEYWGLFMGGTLMSVTGIALMFPELITQYLPGLLVAAFRVMHGLEATFAVLVVVLWHSYGVILRPEVFPLDTSIFTGKISKHRLEEEHGLEYERLFPEEIEESEAEEVGAAD